MVTFWPTISSLIFHPENAKTCFFCLVGQCLELIMFSLNDVESRLRSHLNYYEAWYALHQPRPIVQERINIVVGAVFCIYGIWDAWNETLLCWNSLKAKRRMDSFNPEADSFYTLISKIALVSAKWFVVIITLRSQACLHLGRYAFKAIPQQKQLWQNGISAINIVILLTHPTYLTSFLGVVVGIPASITSLYESSLKVKEWIKHKL